MNAINEGEKESEGERETAINEGSEDRYEINHSPMFLSVQRLIDGAIHSYITARRKKRERERETVAKKNDLSQTIFIKASVGLESTFSFFLLFLLIYFSMGINVVGQL